VSVTEAATDYYAGRPARQWWLVIALNLAAVVAVIDRSVLSLLGDPIKREIGLSDTQWGLIFGFAFAIANVLFTLPAGYLADRISRRGLIAFGCLIWSGMTGICGTVGSYAQLLVARAGVGAAESIIHPCSFSMLRNSLAPERRGRGFAVYGMSLLVGAALGFMLAGALLHWLAGGGGADWPLLAGLSPWRGVLLILSVLGIPAALLMAFVREPRRGGASGAPEASVRVAMNHMLEQRRVYLLVFLYSSFSSMKANAMAAFIASIPQRRWQVPAADVGVTLGMLQLVFSIAGLWTIGTLVDRLTARHGVQGTVRVGLACMLAGLVFSAAAPIAPSAGWYYCFMAGDFLVGGSAFPIAGAIIAAITPMANMGKTSAVQLAFYGVLGMGIGPALVGIVSDRLFPGPTGIAPALGLSNAVFSGLSVICALLLLSALRKQRQPPAHAH
jgi:MFS family permease